MLLITYNSYHKPITLTCYSPYDIVIHGLPWESVYHAFLFLSKIVSLFLGNLFYFFIHLIKSYGNVWWFFSLFFLSFFSPLSIFTHYYIFLKWGKKKKAPPNNFNTILYISPPDSNQNQIIISVKILFPALNINSLK